MTNSICRSNHPHSPELDRLLKSDCAFNYFIRLGLESEKTIFSDVFVEEDADGDVVGALFRRASGTIQFHALDSADFAGFGEIVTNFAPRRIQGRRDLLEQLAPHCPPGSMVSAAWINRKLLRGSEPVGEPGIRDLEIADLPRVVELYGQVFRSFSSLGHMRRKLAAGRGRGYYLEDADRRITSIVQTEFEEDGESAIVGVATHPDHQRCGLARRLMEYTEARLAADGFRDVYLQFDSEIAKQLYESMGYRSMGRVAYLLTPR